MQEALIRWRYRLWPDHLLGEILSKRWTETAIPVIVLLIVGFALSRAIPGFLSVGSLGDVDPDGSHRPAARLGEVVVSEGYTDVVALHQAGIEHSVGLMGTRRR